MGLEGLPQIWLYDHYNLKKRHPYTNVCFAVYGKWKAPDPNLRNNSDTNQ